MIPFKAESVLPLEESDYLEIYNVKITCDEHLLSDNPNLEVISLSIFDYRIFITKFHLNWKCFECKP